MRAGRSPGVGGGGAYEHPLREARLGAGLTQRVLAGASSVGRATINRIEQGRQAPHRSTAEKLARVLGTEPYRIAHNIEDLRVKTPKRGFCTVRLSSRGAP
ncbi:MAG: helix-turn-helix domain-containing protein [Actinomycetota bacterium]|nr:helix-turn-helix domain-containing protein [Actinomycetota bacterium]